MDNDKLRNVLREARSFIECSPLKTVESGFGRLDRDRICDDIDAALIAGRNCDLPEPRERFKEFCERYSRCCEGCPYDGKDDEFFSCEALWLLDEAKEGGSNV